jgi:hypothetical protein
LRPQILAALASRGAKWKTRAARKWGARSAGFEGEILR